MTNEEFFDKFYFIAPGIPAINAGDVPILVSGMRAYVPGEPADDPNAKCTEYATKEAAEAAYPDAQGYVSVGSE